MLGDSTELTYAEVFNAQAPASVGDSRHAWNIGERIAFDTHVRAELWLRGTSSDPTEAPTAVLDLHGRWETTVTAVSAEQVEMHARFVDVSLSGKSDGPLDGPDRETFVRDLKRGCALRLASDGHVLGLGLAPDTSGAIQRLMKSFAGMTQLTMPAAIDTAWSVEETDAIGMYRAHYRREPSNPVIVKTRDPYHAALGHVTKKPERVSTEVTRAETTFTLDSAGDVRRIEASERIHVHEPSMLDGESATKVMMIRASTTNVDTKMLEELRTELATIERAPLWTDVSKEAVQREVDRTYIAGMSFETLLGQLEGLDVRIEEQRRAMGSVFFGLTGWMRQDAAARRAAAKAVRRGHPHGAVLLGALGEAGTREAQDTLIELAEGDLPKDVDLRLLQALTSSTSPSEASVDFLLHRSQQTKNRDQALLSLGTVAHRLRRTHPAMATMAGRRLHEELTRAKHRSARVLALRALANAGYAGALPDIRAHLSDPSEQVRAAALDGLRRIEDRSIDDDVVKLAVSDLSAAVRLEAIRVMGERGPTFEFMQALDHAVRSETSKRNRLMALSVLLRPEWPIAEAAVPLSWVLKQGFAPEMQHAIEQRLRGATPS